MRRLRLSSGCHCKLLRTGRRKSQTCNSHRSGGRGPRSRWRQVLSGGARVPASADSCVLAQWRAPAAPASPFTQGVDPTHEGSTPLLNRLPGAPPADTICGYHRREMMASRHELEEDRNIQSLAAMTCAPRYFVSAHSWEFLATASLCGGRGGGWWFPRGLSSGR